MVNYRKSVERRREASAIADGRTSPIALFFSRDVNAPLSFLTSTVADSGLTVRIGRWSNRLSRKRFVMVTFWSSILAWIDAAVMGSVTREMVALVYTG